MTDPDIKAHVVYSVECDKCKKIERFGNYSITLGPASYKLNSHSTGLPQGWTKFESWQFCGQCFEPFRDEFIELHMRFHKYVHGYRPDQPQEK